MSHFSVMVVTDSKPSDDELVAIMQPWHEFECTGTDDQYVIEVDETEESKKDFEKYGDDGEDFEKWLEGWCGRKTLTEGDSPDLSDTHKYGYTVFDAEGKFLKTVRRTNPNSKWDYWRIGGRYRAKLQVKQGVTSALSTDPSWEFRPEFNNGREIPQGFDQARVGDIDREAMKQKAIKGRIEWFEECETKSGLSREDFITGIKQKKDAHDEWMKLNEKPRGGEYDKWLKSKGYHLASKASKPNWDLPDLQGMSFEDWAKSAPSLTSFALVKDGKWFARGEMGWWAVVRDENDDWDAEFQKLFASLDDDKWITFLDCHV